MLSPCLVRSIFELSRISHTHSLLSRTSSKSCHAIGQIRYIGMIEFIGPFVALYFWSVSAEGSSTLPYLLCAILAYTGVCILDRSYQKDGNKWNAFQRLEIWSYFTQYFRAGITTESSLDSDQQYIFCSFPHGACKKLR
jgi:hypothetical protein